jgi:hypothetical protein
MTPLVSFVCDGAEHLPEIDMPETTRVDTDVFIPLQIHDANEELFAVELE